MRRLARPIAALPALFLASPALAVDTSFHTYDGFAETVDAFRLVSMIFGDPRYETLVMIVATVGIGLGAIIASVRGTGMGLVAFGFQILIGVGLFVGLIATTGTVHVYDRVRNARSEEHTSELQSLMRISYAVFCLKKKQKTQN